MRVLGEEIFQIRTGQVEEVFMVHIHEGLSRIAGAGHNTLDSQLLIHHSSFGQETCLGM